MTYHTFKDSVEGEYGSFEVFKIEPQRNSIGNEMTIDGKAAMPGWYWWACFPGCLPDGDPSGPFKTEQDAINDAQDF